MSLLDQAANDLKSIVSNVNEFGKTITLTSPADVVTTPACLTNDIASIVDPDTGQLVSGRVASVVMSIQDLDPADIPNNTPDASGKPWRVTFTDFGGTSYTFKVRETLPDRSIYGVVLILENYTP